MTDEDDDAIHPGILLLQEFLKPLKISQNRLARDIDVPVSRIAALVAGERAVTADTAMRLAEYFDTKPELWMNLQASYELSVLRQTEWPDIAARIRPYDPTPTRRGRKPSARASRQGSAQMPPADLPKILRSGTKN
ncbi:MAG: HigA family addiction module antitoxin [Pseudomonadota bacterium]